MQKLSFTSQVPFCFYVKTLFKVRFPGWIKWIGSALYRSMPLDFHINRSSQMDKLRVSFLVLDFSCEHPVVSALCGEVFLFHPGGAFSWMPPPGPPPHLFKDRIIHGVEGFTTGTEPMVIGPSTYHGVELHNQLSSRTILQFFDGSSNLFQERFYV